MFATEEIRSELTRGHCEGSTLSQKGRQALHQGRHAAADAMHRAASALDEAAQRAHVPAGQKAAHRLHDAATYVGNHNANEMKQDATRYFRRNPGGLLAAAAVAGFIFGRMILPDRRRS
jgi:hypothetical protein